MARLLTGKVVSDRNDKTIVVAVETAKIHPIYKKRFTRTKRYQVHDEKNEAKLGDKVMIVETAPISRNKHFRLENVVAKAGVEHVEAEEEASK